MFRCRGRHVEKYVGLKEVLLGGWIFKDIDGFDSSLLITIEEG